MIELVWCSKATSKTKRYIRFHSWGLFSLVKIYSVGQFPSIALPPSHLYEGRRGGMAVGSRCRS
jgi:hypothetical protein